MQYDKEVELRIVSFADAVVYPGAMVIVAVHASLTKRAVAAPWRPDYFTVGTQAARLKRVKKLNEAQVRIFLYDTRVCQPDDDTEDNRCAEEPLATPQ